MSTGAPALSVSGRSSTPILVTLLALLALGLPIAATQLRGSAFLPHLYCYLGNGPLTWTHVTSDLLIGCSYVAISCTLLYIVRQSQKNIPFHWMILAFGLFIVACGGTHFMEVVTIWKPYYWVSAALKVVTAAASVSTAIALPLLTPAILNRLSEATAAEERRTQLETANVELERLYSELREADRMKNALVAQNAARIGDWSWDMRTGKNTWSEAVEVMHGLRPGSYDGRYESWWATVHPDDKDSVAAAMKKALETGEYEVEYRTLRTDNSIYWTAARGKVVNGADGQPERLLGICLDVTGRKINEEALLRAEKLAAAGRLAATVAHEINNPLEAVMNLVFLARTSEGENRPLLDMADRELARVSAIAKQTLGFYRDNSSPTDVSIAELINAVLETYSGKIRSKQLDVKKSIVDDGVVRVRRGVLHQIIANLISNAIDASPLKGSIQVQASPENGYFVIDIVDQGGGISPEVASHLFEPFFTTKRDVGTGLGLWVSKRLIDQLGGTISFESNLEALAQGTRFTIRLPMAITDSAATA
jgi:PAS domain S-box-containing protein